MPLPIGQILPHDVGFVETNFNASAEEMYMEVSEKPRTHTSDHDTLSRRQLPMRCVDACCILLYTHGVTTFLYKLQYSDESLHVSDICRPIDSKPQSYLEVVREATPADYNNEELYQSVQEIYFAVI